MSHSIYLLCRAPFGNSENVHINVKEGIEFLRGKVCSDKTALKIANKHGFKSSLLPFQHKCILLQVYESFSIIYP